MAFGTRYGSTEKVAAEIAAILSSNGVGVKVLDLRYNKKETVSSYGMIVIGSGIMAGCWSKEAQGFMETNQDALRRKKVALFACCGDIEFKKDQSRNGSRSTSPRSPQGTA